MWTRPECCCALQGAEVTAMLCLILIPQEWGNLRLNPMERGEPTLFDLNVNSFSALSKKKPFLLKNTLDEVMT